jgi:hypothetical protein
MACVFRNAAWRDAGSRDERLNRGIASRYAAVQHVVALMKEGIHGLK